MVHSPYPSRPAGRKKGSVPAMDFRHEWKHEIDLSDLTALRRRLRAAARPDPHAPGGNASRAQVAVILSRFAQNTL